MIPFRRAARYFLRRRLEINDRRPYPKRNPQTKIPPKASSSRGPGSDCRMSADRIPCSATACAMACHIALHSGVACFSLEFVRRHDGSPINAGRPEFRVRRTGCARPPQSVPRRMAQLRPNCWRGTAGARSARLEREVEAANRIVLADSAAARFSSRTNVGSPPDPVSQNGAQLLKLRGFSVTWRSRQDSNLQPAE